MCNYRETHAEDREREKRGPDIFHREGSCAGVQHRDSGEGKVNGAGAGRVRAAVLCLLLTGMVCLGAAAALYVPGMTTTALAAPGTEIEAGQTPGSAGAGEEDTLTIEVVGEHSIDDEIIIEDEEVPLAMYTDVPADAGPRHAVMMGSVLICVIGYTVYFDRREKRLFELRREAARAQKEADRRRRSG